MLTVARIGASLHNPAQIIRFAPSARFLCSARIGRAIINRLRFKREGRQQQLVGQESLQPIEKHANFLGCLSTRAGTSHLGVGSGYYVSV